jgi:hypothetical protein
LNPFGGGGKTRNPFSLGIAFPAMILRPLITRLSSISGEKRIAEATRSFPGGSQG